MRRSKRRVKNTTKNSYFCRQQFYSDDFRFYDYLMVCTSMHVCSPCHLKCYVNVPGTSIEITKTNGRTKLLEGKSERDRQNNLIHQQWHCKVNNNYSNHLPRCSGRNFHQGKKTHLICPVKNVPYAMRRQMSLVSQKVTTFEIE